MIKVLRHLCGAFIMPPAKYSFHDFTINRGGVCQVPFLKKIIFFANFLLFFRNKVRIFHFT